MNKTSSVIVPLLHELRRREKDIVRLIGEFVRCESPTYNKAAVDQMHRLVANEWKRRGAKVSVLREPKMGNHLRAEIFLGKGRPKGQILVMGHLDTVYPLGTLAKMPFRVSGGRAWGPGTFDMKGGLVLGLFAVDAIRAAGIAPEKKFVFFCNSDEEIGSEFSRSAIQREARQSDAVLVLEPSLGPEGRLKTERKGGGSVEIIVTGRSAHAGIEPEKGVNAVHELALQIARLMKMNDPRRGTTVQSTVISGGTVTNVIPEHASAKVDIRYARLADAARINHALDKLRPFLKDAQVEVRGRVRRPPLERTAAVRKLFHHAQSLMREAGLTLGEGSTGGGSDGNTTAALGIPTLDGLGAIGNGAHSPQEHVVIRALPPRAALIASLLSTL